MRVIFYSESEIEKEIIKTRMLMSKKNNTNFINTCYNYLIRNGFSDNYVFLITTITLNNWVFKRTLKAHFQNTKTYKRLETPLSFLLLLRISNNEKKREENKK